MERINTEDLGDDDENEDVGEDAYDNYHAHEDGEDSKPTGGTMA